jgi:hypothetical protein
VPGGPSASWPAEMAAEYGEDSPFYVSRVLGEFPADGAEQALIRRDWLEAAAERWEEWRTWRREPLPSARDVAVGVDVGRTGDRSILAVRRGDVLTELRTLPRGDLMETAARVAAEIARIGAGRDDPAREPFPLGSGIWQPAEAPQPGPAVITTWVDIVGIGAGVYDRLSELAVRHVAEFNGGAAPGGPRAERFLNQRAAVYWRLRERLSRREIAIPHHPQLWEQLLATDWTPTGAGKVQLESKELIRRKLHGQSPDHADAVAMTLTGRAVPLVGFFSVDL